MKLVEVMASVDRVGKNGTNASQGYKYAQAADVYDAVRAELARRFVLLVPRLDKVEFQDVPTKAGGVLKLCTWGGAFDFTDAETGEVLSVKAFGQGSDSGDKAGYKAITGATKSVLVQMFLIPTGDDPENEGKPGKPQLPPPAGLASVKAKMPQSAPAGDEPPPHDDSDSPNAAPSRPHVPTSPPTHNRERSFRFGNDKGKQLHELDQGSLRFYEGALKRDLTSDDPAKQKYATDNRAALADVQAELRFKGFAANN